MCIRDRLLTVLFTLTLSVQVLVPLQGLQMLQLTLNLQQVLAVSYTHLDQLMEGFQLITPYFDSCQDANKLLEDWCKRGE